MPNAVSTGACARGGRRKGGDIHTDESLTLFFAAESRAIQSWEDP